MAAFAFGGRLPQKRRFSPRILSMPIGRPVYGLCCARTSLRTAALGQWPGGRSGEQLDQRPAHVPRRDARARHLRWGSAHPVRHWAWIRVLELWFAAMGQSELRAFDLGGHRLESFRETAARETLHGAQEAARAAQEAARAEQEAAPAAQEANRAGPRRTVCGRAPGTPGTTGALAGPVGGTGIGG